MNTPKGFTEEELARLESSGSAAALALATLLREGVEQKIGEGMKVCHKDGIPNYAAIDALLGIVLSHVFSYIPDDPIRMLIVATGLTDMVRKRTFQVGDEAVKMKLKRKGGG